MAELDPRRWRELVVESEDPEAGTVTVSDMTGTSDDPSHVQTVYQTSYPFVPGSVRVFERQSDDDILLRELLGG